MLFSEIATRLATFCCHSEPTNFESKQWLIYHQLAIIFFITTSWNRNMLSCKPLVHLIDTFPSYMKSADRKFSKAKNIHNSSRATLRDCHHLNQVWSKSPKCEINHTFTWNRAIKAQSEWNDTPKYENIIFFAFNTYPILWSRQRNWSPHISSSFSNECSYKKATIFIYVSIL